MTDTADRAAHRARAAALRHPDALRRFLAVADARLGADPAEPSALWARAQLLRGLGEYAAAAEAYDAYARIRPEDARAPALARQMRGDPEGVVSLGGPVPFLRIDGFLPAPDLAALWERVEAHRPRFAPSGVHKREGTRVDPSKRVSVLADADAELRGFLRPRVEAAMATLGLPGRFALPDLAGGRLEMQVTSHTGAGFFRAHRDSGYGAPGRTLTYLCYLRRPAARFTGGDLLLLDETGDGFTRVVPTDNVLLFFPSDRLHEVTAVACDAVDPLDGRVTVNGWFHRPEA